MEDKRTQKWKTTRTTVHEDWGCGNTGERGIRKSTGSCRWKTRLLASSLLQSRCGTSHTHSGAGQSLSQLQLGTVSPCKNTALSVWQEIWQEYPKRCLKE